MSPHHHKIRIVCISDTHGYAPGEGYVLPSGDILIHAGDLTNQGSLREVQKATRWLGAQEGFGAKIVIAGNHDVSLDAGYTLRHAAGWSVLPTDVAACRALVEENPDFVYLRHSSALVHLPAAQGVRLRIFGSPYSPDRGRQNWGFQYGADGAAALWEEVPDDTDVLITHTPAKGWCDASAHWGEGGCEVLRERVAVVRPLVHVCGHCHEGRGAVVVDWGREGEERVRVWEDASVGSKKLSVVKVEGRQGAGSGERGATTVVNASIMGKSYGRGKKVFNKAIVVDLMVPCERTADVDGE